MRQNWCQAGTAPGHGGATQALLSFALEQLYLKFIPCQLWDVTGVIPQDTAHVLRSHRSSLQSFTLILGRERESLC